MKKIALLLVLALIFASLTALADTPAQTENPTLDFAGRWADPVYGRAALRILRPTVTPEDETPRYDAQIRWGSSADSEGVWQMTAVYDEATGSLVYQNGVMSSVTYNENGSVKAEEVQWNDAEGAFWFDEDGALRWQDSRETRSADFRMERVVSEPPAAEDFAERYFLPVANVEIGTAGASLKQAIVARDVVLFAYESDLWNTDNDSMHEAMLAAWEGLDDDTRARFDENLFGGVIGELANGIYQDYDNLAGRFEEAGVGEDAAFLNADAEACESWAILFVNTITLGNSED